MCVGGQVSRPTDKQKWGQAGINISKDKHIQSRCERPKIWSRLQAVRGLLLKKNNKQNLKEHQCI